jgi:thiamine kinase-like enzyme
VQIDALEARLTRDHANWLGFCHNDLQCGNVMLDASSLESLRGGVGGAAAAAVAAVDLGTLVSRCGAALIAA